MLEDAGINLDSVVTDVLGKAARRMLEPLIAGERDVQAMADMALTRMRPTIGRAPPGTGGSLRRPITP